MLFEHADEPQRELCRIERDGTRVTVHHHRPDDAGRVEAFDHDTFDAAQAEYDRQIVRVYERGYRLVRDWVDPPLAHDARLEAMIAEDPYDDARWMVLADWVLTCDDARANIVRFEQSRRSRDPSESWGQYPVELFGGVLPAALLTEPLSRGDWQAGHVRACHLPLGADSILEAFVAAPATRLGRDLGFSCSSAADVEDALAAFARAPARPVLRRLHLEFTTPISLAVLDPILACATAPALTTLSLSLAHQSTVAAIDRIADSPLRPQLQGLEFGSREMRTSALLHRYSAQFQRLKSFKLPTRDDEAFELLREAR